MERSCGVRIWANPLYTALIKDGVAYVPTRQPELVQVKNRASSINWQIPLQGLVQSSPTLVANVGMLVMGGQKVPKLYGVEMEPNAIMLWGKNSEWSSF